MNRLSEKINKIFIKKMVLSFLAQLIIFTILIIFVKNVANDNQANNIANDLLIRDEYILEKIAQYQILNAKYALNLELYNLESVRKLDSIVFSPNISNATLGYTCQSLNSKNFKLCQNKDTYLGISTILVSNKILGYVITIKNYHLFSSSNAIYDLLLILLSVIGIFILNFGLLFLPLKKKIEDNTHALVKFISQSNIEPSPYLQLTIDEYQIIAKKFIDEHQKITILQAEKAYYEARKNIAEQVAHDIRSPLAAINTAIVCISKIPENQRIMIKNASQRINDIANNLLMNSKKPLPNVETVSAPELIFNVLESILTEKNYEYRNEKFLRLIISEHSYHCFAAINLASFKRVLSNLINNSAEAIKDKELIQINLDCTEHMININIIDKGCGIPKKILLNIGKQGFSFGKNSGRGYGLYHAIQEIKKVKGELSIESKVNVGTTVTIQLPRQLTPPWFCDSLAIKPNISILILDNNPSSHKAWKKKLYNYPDIKLIHFSKSINLTSQKIKELNIDICFISYELDNIHNGLDLIESLEIKQFSYLITDSFEENIVRNRAEKMKIKIIPKTYIQHLPIFIVKHKEYEIELLTS